jgi:hypothetical protein
VRNPVEESVILWRLSGVSEVKLVDESEQAPVEVAAQVLIYEPNPKHKPIPSPGRHGSICPPDANGPELLKQSVLDTAKRYATDGSRAYCAQEHEAGKWHGYPVDWEEVPPRLISAWITARRIERKVIRRDRRRRGR